MTKQDEGLKPGQIEKTLLELTELKEKLDAVALRKTVRKHGEILVAQRLGYLLDYVGCQDITKGFLNWIKDAPLRLLDPSAPAGRAKENRKWRLIVNARLETET